MAIRIEDLSGNLAKEDMGFLAGGRIQLGLLPTEPFRLEIEATASYTGA